MKWILSSRTADDEMIVNQVKRGRAKTRQLESLFLFFLPLQMHLSVATITTKNEHVTNDKRHRGTVTSGRSNQNMTGALRKQSATGKKHTAPHYSHILLSISGTRKSRNVLKNAANFEENLR